MLSDIGTNLEKQFAYRHAAGVFRFAHAFSEGCGGSLRQRFQPNQAPHGVRAENPRQPSENPHQSGEW